MSEEELLLDPTKAIVGGWLPAPPAAPPPQPGATVAVTPQTQAAENPHLDAASGPQGVCAPRSEAPPSAVSDTQTQAQADPWPGPPPPVPGTPMSTGVFLTPVGDPPPLRRRLGKPHPFRPQSPQEIAEFARLWRDPRLKVRDIARRYRCGERSVQYWAAKEFDLESRPEALRRWSGAPQGMDQAPSTMGVAMAPAAPCVGGPEARVPPGPLEDPEIRQALADLADSARQMSGSSDLAAIQRKLLRLALLAVTKKPVQSWDTVEEAATAQARALLMARKVEAELPEPEIDRQQLRREAATQMLKELKSVATVEEQRELATLMKRLSDRLIAVRAGKAGGSAPGGAGH